MEPPCKECISFAICNAQINAMELPDVTQHSVMRDCKSLMDYTHVARGSKEISTIDKARELFGLEALYG